MGGGQCCSLAVLCLGGVAGLTAMALVAIGVSTDHWTRIEVNREEVIRMGMGNRTEQEFFTRTTGIFRVCFPEPEKPAEGSPGLFLSIVEDWCYSRTYQVESLLEGEWQPRNLSYHGGIQLQLMRSTPLLILTYIISMLLVGLLGLCGCWQQSANKLISTAAGQLMCALIGACAMATWHAALFFEMEKVYDDSFPLTWPEWLQKATVVETSWSYIVSWAGVCLTLLASLATSAAAICLRSQRREWENNTMRMKLKMSSMFAHHAYFPHEVRSSPSVQDSRDYLNYPTIPANYPTSLAGPRFAEMTDLEYNKLTDYKKVVHQLENSNF